MAGGQPKAPFWLAVWAVILGLVALAERLSMPWRRPAQVEADW